MRTLGRLLALTLIPHLMLFAQQRSQTPPDVGDEPHHRLLLENSSVRVYKLTLAPDEATVPHRHARFYVFVSLGTSSIDTEVRGRSPIKSELNDGELRTSKGGFTIAERNTGTAAAEIIVIEPRDPLPGARFAESMANFRYHDAAVGPVFEEAASRGYDTVLAAGGRFEKHDEKYDHLLLSLTDLRLKDATEGAVPAEISESAGQVVWLSRGGVHAFTNVGSQPAHFITIEFP